MLNFYNFLLILLIKVYKPKTALTITTPRSSTRSFANDLVPRLSTRVVQGLGPTLVAALKVNDRRGGTRRYLSLSVEGEAHVNRRF